MTALKLRYTKQEFARLGDEIDARTVRSQIEPSNKGKIVAIDLETGVGKIDSKEQQISQDSY